MRSVMVALVVAWGTGCAGNGAQPDAAPVCLGDPSGGCETVVASADECPALDQICAHVCGASYDCCYCGNDGRWTTLYLDCPWCPDAAVDASPDAGPDASDDAGLDASVDASR